MFKKARNEEREIKRLTNILTAQGSNICPELYLYTREGIINAEAWDAVERVTFEISPEGKQTHTVRMRDKIDAAEKLMKLLKI